MTPYPLRSNGKWLRVRYGAIMTPYQMICGSPFKMVVNLDFWHLWVFFYWFSKSFEDGKILPKKWLLSDFFWKIKLYQLCHFSFCSNWSLSLFNFHESFSITGDTIRNGLDDSGFFVDECPSVPPQDQREGPLERLTRVCGRALLCPERTCAAVKSHTEKGENGEKYFGKTGLVCPGLSRSVLVGDLDFSCGRTDEGTLRGPCGPRNGQKNYQFFYTSPKWFSPDKMGWIRALHSLFIALYLLKLHLDQYCLKYWDIVYLIRSHIEWYRICYGVIMKYYEFATES